MVRDACCCARAESGHAAAVTQARLAGLEGDDLARPDLVRYSTFDGREVPAWLYRPTAEGPLPALLAIHGGPELQERPAYEPLWQYLVALPNRSDAIRVAPDIGPFIADDRRVRQALFNLLSNAIGFSPQGETITLSAQRLKDAVRFSVTDHGPGIPADLQDRVFGWFETHSLGSRHRGTGLGLSLVRSFVELHGGTVTLDSAVGRGTTVTCIFPLGEAGARTAA